MATFLQLVNRVERESGTIGQSQRLSSVTGAVGRQEKIVYWTSQAWEIIQRLRPDWTFARREFSHALTIGQARYAAADLGIADFGGWMPEADGYSPYSLYDPAIGQADETRVRVRDYRVWRDAYDFGAPDPMRPNILAFDPERRLCAGPVPDKAYVLRGDYRRSIQTLTSDADEPFISADFHDTIVWQALILLADHDEAIAPSLTAARSCAAGLSAMVREYTEAVT